MGGQLMTKEQEAYQKGYSKGLQVLGNEVEHTTYSQEDIGLIQYFIDGVINAMHTQRQALKDFKGGVQ